MAWLDSGQTAVIVMVMINAQQTQSWYLIWIVITNAQQTSSWYLILILNFIKIDKLRDPKLK